MSNVDIDSSEPINLENLSITEEGSNILQKCDDSSLETFNESQESTTDPTNAQTDFENSGFSNDKCDKRKSCEKAITENDSNLHDEALFALKQRKQPLMELINSEEGYVRRLRLVKDFYMPAVSFSNTQANSLDSAVNIALPNLSQTQDSQTAPPMVPEDLAARWRIVWGNWIQLYEWHSTFYEKIISFIDKDPDRIPKLFIDSRARLRSIYSKYCENHRKAALIAEQYREYFEELRLYIKDKEDVVSHLMQPVQRIMRYQLPIAEILKYTQRAGLTEVLLWKKTLEIMKELPKDTQLILEVNNFYVYS